MNTEYTRILIVDDNPDVRNQFFRWLKIDGYFIDEAENGKMAIKKLEEKSYDVMLLDLMLPDMNGIDVLKKVNDEYPDTCVIIITAHPSIERLKKAFKEGTCEFLEKGIKIEELSIRIKKSLEQKRILEDAKSMHQDEQQKFSFNSIVGLSSKLMGMLQLIKKVAKTEAPILILGESGTGKELVAKVIHYNSPRHNKTLMIADCSTITPSLIESELFGHEKGAFTGAIKRKKGKFERAHEGTLFIDEIGELEQPLQMKLLRFLQEGTIERVGGEEVIKVNARVLAATAVDLKKAIEAEKFRKDLYYRLNVVTIEIPPLRERQEDIPLLVDHFIKIYSRKNLKTIKSIASDAMRLLLNYDFRGNVRELENIIHRAIVLTEGDEIKPDVIGFDLSASQQTTITKYFDLPIREFNDACERDYLVTQLNKHDWHISKTAEIIGIDRSNLTLKMKRYGITNHR